MRKKLLLLGAMAILSTTAMGSNENTWEALRGKSIGSYEKTNGMVESAKKLDINVTANSVETAGKQFQENDKAQAEVFDKTVFFGCGGRI